MTEEAKLTLDQFHKSQAVDLFNEVWSLMEKPARSEAETLRMIHAAHASRLHWEVVGRPVNLVIGEWQVSRVYAVLGRAEPALFHARQCHALCCSNGIGGFHLAEAHEAMARAFRVAHDPSADEHLHNAREIARTLTDAEEIGCLERDLGSLPK